MATITLVYGGRKLVSGTLWTRIPAAKGASSWEEWGKGSSVTNSGQVFLKDSAKLHEFKIQGRIETGGPQLHFSSHTHHLLGNFTLHLDLVNKAG